MDYKKKKKELEEQFNKVNQQVMLGQQELQRLIGEYRLITNLEKESLEKTKKDKK